MNQHVTIVRDPVGLHKPAYEVSRNLEMIEKRVSIPMQQTHVPVKASTGVYIVPRQR